MNTVPYLRSPITEKTERFAPNQDIFLEPFSGRKKSLKLFRTEYTIGTDIACDIRLEDPFVCPRHAHLRYQPALGGYEVEDLASKNGVFLNGVRVQKAVLPEQGSLRIGRSNLLWGKSVAQNLEGDFFSVDPLLQAMLLRLKSIAQSNLPILILGETGSGKEVLARTLHRWSQRSERPFVPLNGAGLDSGLADSELFGHRKGAYTGAEQTRIGALKAAHKGTLFLDEVGDLPLSTQLKLLRAIENGELKALGSDAIEQVNFRLITATSRNIMDKISDGSFRLDFYHRIAGYVVNLPSLRERKEDILAITQKVLSEKRMFLTNESKEMLLQHSWPGNVRELKSSLERAIILARAEESRQVLPHHLALREQALPTQRKQKIASLDEIEKEHIEFVLEKVGWSRKIAAQNLGIARSTLFEKMKKYSLEGKASP